MEQDPSEILLAEDKRSFYEILGVTESASASEIKRAYYKLALKYHPDRVKTDSEEEKAKASQNFQALGKIYETLSDPKRRALYDATGEACDDDLFKDRDWDEYWRGLFPPVTMADIANYEKKYKGSQIEKDDVLKAYTDGKGSMEYIIENVILSSWDDEARFNKIIENGIKKGLIQRIEEGAAMDVSGSEEESEDLEEEEKENKKKQPAKNARGKASSRGGRGAAGRGKKGAKEASGNTKKRKYEKQRKAEKDEAAEAMKLAKTLGIKVDSAGDEDSLRAMIVSNQNKAQSRFNSLIAGLEAKYSPPPKRGRKGGAATGGRRKKVESEPSEEEFQAARERMEARRKGK